MIQGPVVCNAKFAQNSSANSTPALQHATSWPGRVGTNVRVELVPDVHMILGRSV